MVYFSLSDRGIVGVMACSTWNDCLAILSNSDDD
jgi:hypothetical protein